jgi:excisionase family DNA binding protein
MRAFVVRGPGAKGAPWFQYGSNFPAGCARAVLREASIGRMSTRLLTAAEVAERLGVPRSWVYEQSRRGLIPTVALGRYRRFRAEAIAAFVERLERDAASRRR